jgi:cytochrome P450/NADPH-cytochrome P450 reductase
MVHNLIKNPDAMARLRAEVDSVLGDRQVQLTDLPNLPYLVGASRSYLQLGA